MEAVLRCTHRALSLLVLLFSANVSADLVTGDSTLEQRNRVARTVFEYTYRLEVTNSGGNLGQVTAVVTSSSPYTVIVDGQLEFGDIAASATVSSIDTYRIRQDRTVPFDPSLLTVTYSSLPVADAGPDQLQVPLGTTVTLDGSGSSPGHSGSLPLSFAWNFVLPLPVGSGAVLSNATSPNPEFAPDVPGSYTVELTVNDGVADSEPDTVLVTTDPAPGVLTCGSLVSASILAAGEQDFYTFSGQAGQVINLTLVETSDWGGSLGGVDARLTLISPSGVETGPFDSSVQPRFDLSESGTYVVRINANNLVGVGDYNLGLECLLPQQSPDAVAISCGDLLSGSIAAAGEVDLFTFGGQAGESVNLTLVETSDWGGSLGGVDARLTLISPSGVETGPFDSSVQPRFDLSESGTYVVRINANNLVGVGDYNLGLECLLPQQSPDAVAISCGDLLSGSIAAAGEVDLFTFGGQAGESVNLTLVETSDWGGSLGGVDARLTLISPSGVETGPFDSSVQPRFDLSESGTYVVRINANNLVGVGDYNLGLECLLPQQSPDAVAISCGDLLSGSIAAAGEVDLFTFGGQAGESVNLTLVETSDWGGSLGGVDARLTLISPSGVETGPFDSSVQPRFDLSESGTYVVRINANNLVGVGDYNLGLECLLPQQSPDAVAISCGDLLSGSIAAAGEVDLFTFGGQAGESVNLTLVETSDWGGSLGGVDARLTLISPSGVETGPFDSSVQPRFDLSESGTYVVRINANNLVGVGDYNLGLECLLPQQSPDAVAISCGDLRNGSIVLAGEVDLFTLPLLVGQTLSFTLTETSDWGGSLGGVDARLTLISPSGAETGPFDSNTQQSLVAAETGIHVLRINANNLVGGGDYNVGTSCL